MIDKKKYDLHFEFEEKRNESNEEEFEKFKENLKLKLSKDYNIPPKKNNSNFATKRKSSCSSNISNWGI